MAAHAPGSLRRAPTQPVHANRGGVRKDGVLVPGADTDRVDGLTADVMHRDRRHRRRTVDGVGEDGVVVTGAGRAVEAFRITAAKSLRTYAGGCAASPRDGPRNAHVDRFSRIEFDGH